MVTLDLGIPKSVILRAYQKMFSLHYIQFYIPSSHMFTYYEEKKVLCTFKFVQLHSSLPLEKHVVIATWDFIT